MAANIIPGIDNKLVVIDAQPLDQNPAAVYLASLTPAGRRSQDNALRTIAQILTGVGDWRGVPWAALRFQHTAAIRQRLAAAYAPATANRVICALRGTLKAAWRLGQIEAGDYTRAADIAPVNGYRVPAGRELSQGEITALMSNCESDPRPAGARDGAIIALMYAGGLRREEVVNLDLADYTPQEGRLTLIGKRNKQRTAYLVNGAARAMADWLAVRGDNPGPLFLAISKGGKIGSERLTTQAIYNMLARRADLAGVRKFSPHDLRRTFVSDLLDAGADIATVAKMAGHSSVSTTARYDRRPEAAKAKAAGLLHVPYHGRGMGI